MHCGNHMALYMQYYKTSTFKVTVKSKVALPLLSVTTSLLFYLF